MSLSDEIRGTLFITKIVFQFKQQVWVYMKSSDAKVSEVPFEIFF